MLAARLLCDSKERAFWISGLNRVAWPESPLFLVDVSQCEQWLLERMPSSPALIFMVIFFLESLAAMLQNGFMVTVLGMEWVRRRMLPAGDMIVASLAASRFCLHGVAILNNLLTFFDLPDPLELHQHSHFLAHCLACHLLLCEDRPLLPPCLLLAEVEDFSVSAQAAAGLPGLGWSDSHLISHWD